MEIPTDNTGTFQARPQPGPLSRILDSVLEAGRAILNRRGGPSGKSGAEARGDYCTELVHHRGEASGLALAEQTLNAYENLPEDARSKFFDMLVCDFSPNSEQIRRAAEDYLDDGGIERIDDLRKAIESPCRRLFRRLNMVPGGTSSLVRMRGDILQLMPSRPGLKGLDTELKQLLIAWFNRGFLTLQRIDWDSPASVLEKFIEYEAVHEINGWEDLRSRLKQDRRLFAFFHPAMASDPLIFVQVALGKGSANAIESLIGLERQILDTADANTATFYSITNCHKGLQGISFGNFLIKQVAAELSTELPMIGRFETLSPVPGFRRWTEDVLTDRMEHSVPHEILNTVGAFLADDGSESAVDPGARDACVKLCAHYLMNEKRDSHPANPVARFHLGNGALLDRIHWAADESEVGWNRSFGIMVNYVYEPGEIENRHEAYFAEGRIAASPSIRKLVRV
jgi:malonyl-CoA decarboxylase